ncbi:hypothetical protein K2X85_12905 [bacterium]|jgi:hypothetical protein|nr:hypothetical protein [bacterium]
MKLKRYFLAVAASALVGCQSPMGSLSSRMGGSPGCESCQVAANGRPAPPTEGLWASRKSGSNLVGRPVPESAHVIPAEARQQKGDVVPVGYNNGWGGIQNDHFSGKVARAIPSHGGSLPGGPAYPYSGEGMGMPGGGPGSAGGACPPGGACGPGGPSPLVTGPMPQSLMPRFVAGRTQVRFTKPTGMKVGWQAGGAFTPAQLEAPARYNFHQARIYRLKLTEIENRPGVELYPTLEIYPGNMKVDAYLAHNAVPIEFTEEDFDQVTGGNFVTKVIYLPDPKYQELAIAGVETLVSTRLDPGIDPVQEASRRGTILAVLRIGSVDLEMPHSPELFPAPPMPPAPIAPPISAVPSAMPIESSAMPPTPGDVPAALPEAAAPGDAPSLPDSQPLPFEP